MKIEIYHQTYNVQAEENEEYLNELAAYVDAKMRAVAEATQSVDTIRIAVLAALNIADELHSKPAAAEAGAMQDDEPRQRRMDADPTLRRRLEECVALVDKALVHTA